MKLVKATSSESVQEQQRLQQQAKIAKIKKLIREKDVNDMSLKELAFLHKYDVLTSDEKIRVKFLKSGQHQISAPPQGNSASISVLSVPSPKTRQHEAHTENPNGDMPSMMFPDTVSPFIAQNDEPRNSEVEVCKPVQRVHAKTLHVDGDSYRDTQANARVRMVPDDDSDSEQNKRIARKVATSVKTAFAQPIVIISVLVLLFIVLFMRSYLVPSGSMKPTLNEGNRIMTTSIYFPSEDSVERGDIVCFHPPHKPTEVYVKRVLAKEGDRVQISGNDIYVNGELSPYGKSGGVITSLDVTISPGHLWMAGDNGAVSEDSRYWGELPVENLISKVHAIWWPIGEAKMLHDIDVTTWCIIGITIGAGVFVVLRRRRNAQEGCDDEFEEDVPILQAVSNARGKKKDLIDTERRSRCCPRNVF